MLCLALGLELEKRRQRVHGLVEPKLKAQLVARGEEGLRRIERRFDLCGRAEDGVLQRLIVFGEVAGGNQDADHIVRVRVHLFGVVETLLVGCVRGEEVAAGEGRGEEGEENCLRAASQRQRLVGHHPAPQGEHRAAEGEDCVHGVALDRFGNNVAFFGGEHRDERDGEQDDTADGFAGEDGFGG